MKNNFFSRLTTFRKVIKITQMGFEPACFVFEPSVTATRSLSSFPNCGEGPCTNRRVKNFF